MNTIDDNIANVKEKSLFESVWEESFDGMRLIDEKGIIILVNNAFCKLVSLSKSQLIGKDLSIIYSADSQNSILAHAIERVKTGSVSRKIERELTLWNEKKVWFELSNSEIINEDGSKYILSIFRDISKQKIAQEELIESEKRFRKIFTESTDPVLLLGENGIIDCNSATLNILGYEHKSEILYKQPIEFSPEYQSDGKLSSQKAKDAIELAYAKGYYQFEWIHTKKDGTDFPVEVMLTPILVSGENILHIVWRDILKRKIIEEELKFSEKRFRELFEQSVDIVCTFSFDGVFKSVSPSVEAVLGYSPDELIGTSLNSIMQEDSYKITEQERDRKLKHPSEISVYEIELFTKDGGTKVVEVKSKLLLDNGKPYEILAFAHDITERKRIEDNLRIVSTALQESNAAKDKFLSILSHDLKSPFNGFLGISNIIANEIDTITQDELKFMGVELHKSLIAQYKLLEDLLEWSRLQSGRINFKPKSLNVKQELTEIVNRFSSNILTKKINVSIEVDEQISFFADKHLFNTLFRNLFSNALKFSNNGGKIVLNASSDEHFLTLSIHDNGVGIESGSIPNLFKLDSNTSTLGTEGEKGTGLGLILCKEIMDKHNGKIEVESVLNEGTTFYTRFPLSE
jgi:PAS domain S-box-containing protein